MTSYEAHNKQYEDNTSFENELFIHNLKTTESLNKSGQNWDNLYKPGFLHGNWLDEQTEITDAVDIGSGTGWFVNYLINYKNFENVIGIEPSKAAIDIAKKLYDNDITYLCGFAENELKQIKLQKKTLFTTSIVFSHLDDISVTKILTEMNNIAPKGSVFIFNENYGPPFHMKLWNCRPKEWWQKRLSNWNISYDERTRPDLRFYKQGLMGIKYL